MIVEEEIARLGGYAIWIWFFVGFVIGNFSGLSFGIKSKSEMEADAKFTNDLMKECKDLRDKLKG